jgi:hypothetical protein
LFRRGNAEENSQHRLALRDSSAFILIRVTSCSRLVSARRYRIKFKLFCSRSGLQGASCLTASRQKLRV